MFKWTRWNSWFMIIWSVCIIDMYYLDLPLIFIWKIVYYLKNNILYESIIICKIIYYMKIFVNFFSFETFNKNLKTWLKVYINNVGYEIIYTYNIIYVWLWMSWFEVEKSFPVALKEEHEEERTKRSASKQICLQNQYLLDTRWYTALNASLVTLIHVHKQTHTLLSIPCSILLSLSLFSDFCHSYMTRRRPPRFTATCHRILSAGCEFCRPNWQNDWPRYLFMTEW